MTIYQVMPDLSAEDFAVLKADIASRGVLIPVEYDEGGEILDGHHRVRACEELGITGWPRFVRKGLSEAEKRVHARQLNLARRHLNGEQKRGLIADQLRETPEVSNRQIAAGLGVDDKTVGTVRSELVGRAEIPHVESVLDKLGRLQQARKPMRTSFIDDTPEGKREALDRSKVVRADTLSTRRTERIERIAEISKGNAQLGTETKYPIIYADPPWRYEHPPMGGNRVIENHYPTMSLDEICALPVSDLAAADAMLFMWATAPKLAECMKVIEAWGFEYRTCAVWDKEIIGMGYYVRNQHELLLIAKRGDIPTPEPGTQPSSVYRERRGEHSAKPSYYRDMIAALYPSLPKIEMFCRSAPEGWAVWGNQSGASDAA